MDGKSRDKSIKTINMSLEVVYCSTTLSNYGPIRFKIFVSQFSWGCEMSFVSYPTLILLISGQTFGVIVALKKYGN